MYIQKTILCSALSILSLSHPTVAQTSSSPSEVDLFVGTYTSGGSEGIYTYRFNQETGEVAPLAVTKISNPSYMTLSKDRKYLYSVSENNNDTDHVATFAYAATTGELTKLGEQKTRSTAPCFILDGPGWVATANYGGGTVTVFPKGEDQVLQRSSDQIIVDNACGELPSHMHCLQFSPDQKYLFATDLGKDKIHRFHVSSPQDIQAGKSRLEPLNPAVVVKFESGPRHLTFAPSGKYAYLINELAGTVLVYRYHDGELTQIQSVAADTAGGNGSADIRISPDGKFLYASNRIKEDGIAIFAIDPTTGKLTKTGYQNTGIHPRNFCISPNGKYLLVACRDSNSIQLYNRDASTGQLTYMGSKADIAVDKPCFVQIL